MESANFQNVCICKLMSKYQSPDCSKRWKLISVGSMTFIRNHAYFMCHKVTHSSNTYEGKVGLVKYTYNMIPMAQYNAVMF